eukprot:s399_g2.t2
MPVPRFLTVLMAASDHGHVEVVRILLEAGADENLVDIDGFTALILASEQGALHPGRSGQDHIEARAFLMLDGPNALHMAPRAVFRGLVAAASAAFHLEGPGPMAATHLALSKLASISYEGDAAACVEFWRSDYEKREGSFHVLHSWLMGFPRHLPDLLGLLAGLASGGGALFVAELLQAPLNSLQLPYRLLRHLTDFEDQRPLRDFSRPPRGTRIVLRGSAYVEELALRLLALELPETWPKKAEYNTFWGSSECTKKVSSSLQDMARRTGVLALALLALAAFAGTAFVSAPAQAEHATAELQTKARLDRATEMAILGAVAGAAPEVAHAGNSGYALLQLGWAVFIISLGPAVLFWVYFNKPELL